MYLSSFMYKLSPNTNRYFAKQKYWQVNQEIGFLLYDVYECVFPHYVHMVRTSSFFIRIHLFALLSATTNKIIINRFLKSFILCVCVCVVTFGWDVMPCQKTTNSILHHFVSSFASYALQKHIISNWHFHFQIQSYLTNTHLITILPKITLL